jgi:hypothetical protein
LGADQGCRRSCVNRPVSPEGGVLTANGPERLDEAVERRTRVPRISTWSPAFASAVISRDQRRAGNRKLFPSRASKGIQPPETTVYKKPRCFVTRQPMQRWKRPDLHAHTVPHLAQWHPDPIVEVFRADR